MLKEGGGGQNAYKMHKNSTYKKAKKVKHLLTEIDKGAIQVLRNVFFLETPYFIYLSPE